MSRLLLDNNLAYSGSFQHMMQNAFADDDNDEPRVHLGQVGAQSPVSWLGHLGSSSRLLPVSHRNVSLDNNPFYSADLSC